MPSKKAKQKLMKRRIAMVARVGACASFLILTIIGVSSLVRAMSLEAIANENGIPSSWKAASLGNPDTITMPITYWDQRQEDCSDPNRQFEWTQCQLYAKGIVQGVVRDRLGTDGLPVPSYANSTDAWTAYHDVFTANVTGHNPVLPTDNFYRWFHEAYDTEGNQISLKINREVTFRRTGNNSYEYGSKGTFPIDNINFSKTDAATRTGHNFHFTAHMRIPMKISADGTETFWFSGDDDVWVFLNNQLVLDLGGLHSDTEGSFVINANGNVVSTVNDVAEQSCRQGLSDPRKVGNSVYNSQLERCPHATKTTTVNTNFKSGDVVNLDFFYAERSTSESNTRINITNMNWPISADSEITGKVVGQIDDTDNQLMQFDTSITNRDPENHLQLERLAAYIKDSSTEGEKNEGFIPLSKDTLYYTTTPDDDSSWQPVEISAPGTNSTAFTLNTPLVMSPSGIAGDTLHFRFFAETSSEAGKMTSTVSYYTTLNGTAGVTYDYNTVPYEKPIIPEYTVTINYLKKSDESPVAEAYVATLPNGSNFQVNSPIIEGYTAEYTTVSGKITDNDLTYNIYYSEIVADEPIVPPVDPEPTPVEPEIPELPNEDIPTPPILPVLPSLPSSDIINGELLYLAPLGEVAYVPNTGIIGDTVAAIFEVGFAEIILSQGFVMLVLLVFAGSFATWFSLRKYMSMDFATYNITKKQHPKMPSSSKATRAKITARNAHASRTHKAARKTNK